MNLDDIKDQLKERLHSAWARLQENGTFIQLTDKFQNLPPRGQKAAIAGGVFLVLMLLFSIPFVYYSSSQTAVAEFEEKKQLIRDLFRVSRASVILQNAPRVAGSMELMSGAQNQLNIAQLQPEQIRGVTDYDNAPKSGGTIPKNVLQKGVQVSLAKLNLRQIVDIGHGLQTMHPSAKMVGLEVTANQDNPHFFDVVYRIVAFNIPEEPAPAPKPKPGAKGPKRPAKPAPDSKNDEEF
jgi:hypothetical protein